MFKIILLLACVIIIGQILYDKVIYPRMVDRSMKPYLKLEEQKNGTTKS